MKRPGMIPAINRDTTDEPVDTLYKTIGIDCGIITPTAAATKDKAKEPRASLTQS